jgi:hypothetical protein
MNRIAMLAGENAGICQSESRQRDKNRRRLMRSRYLSTTETHCGRHYEFGEIFMKPPGKFIYEHLKTRAALLQPPSRERRTPREKFPPSSVKRTFFRREISAAVTLAF